MLDGKLHFNSGDPARGAGILPGGCHQGFLVFGQRICQGSQQIVGRRFRGERLDLELEVLIDYDRKTFFLISQR